MQRKYTLDDAELDARIEALVQDVGDGAAGTQYVTEAVTAALKLLRDGANRHDTKLATNTLKEMRHAFRVFSQYRGVPKVTIFGSARERPGTPNYEMAQRFARKIVKHGYMVMTGGGPGIMEAGNAGATAERSFGLNVQLPFEQEANPVILGDAKSINFKFFYTRKLFFVKEAQAVVLCPGGFGTLDEAFETLTLMQTGRTPIIPIVMMDRPGGHYWSTFRYGLVDRLLADGLISAEDVHLFRMVEHEDDAVEAIVRFYRVYHSQRAVGDDLVLRLKKALTPTQVAELNVEYARLVRPGAGPMRLSEPLPQESNEPELAALPRLLVPFNHRSYGLLRRLIDAVNGFDVPVSAQAPTE